MDEDLIIIFYVLNKIFDFLLNVFSDFLDENSKASGEVLHFCLRIEVYRWSFICGEQIRVYFYLLVALIITTLVECL